MYYFSLLYQIAIHNIIILLFKEKKNEIKISAKNNEYNFLNTITGGFV